jgi:hypothetical protein
MRHGDDHRALADPDAAARRLIEIANTIGGDDRSVLRQTV